MNEPILEQRDLQRDREEVRRSAPSGDDLDAMFARIADETVDHEPTPVERLRELPTRWRVPLAVLVAVLSGAGLLAVMGIRPDLSPGGLARYVATLSILVGMVSLAVALSLRGPHKRPVGRWAWAFTVAALLLPLALAFLPSLWTGQAPTATRLGGPGFMCFALGLGTAAVVGGVVRLFQRDRGGPDWRLTALAAAGGLVAFTTVELHCASTDLLHLVIGHGLIGLTFAALVWVVARLRRA